MIRYIIKRLLWMIPVLLGVTLIVFFLLQVSPNDPATAALSLNASAEDKEAWREERGLNDPFLVQFGRYCYNVFFKLDFGTSYAFKTPVAGELAQRLPKTLLLMFMALCVGQGVGIPIGILSAVKQYSWQDNLVMVLAIIGISMPIFWSGLMLSILFSLKLQWLPATGFYGPKYYILPTISLALAGIGQTARMTRSSMLDVIRQDYITTHRAKGLSERTIHNRHALKNALIPILTQTGMGACTLLGSAMVAEIVFSIPGIGTFMVNSIKSSDYPAVLGSVLAVAFCASIILLIIDLCYAFVDPRIRAQYAAKKVRPKRKAVEA